MAEDTETIVIRSGSAEALLTVMQALVDAGHNTEIVKTRLIEDGEHDLGAETFYESRLSMGRTLRRRPRGIACEAILRSFTIAKHTASAGSSPSGAGTS